ncbi:hypothetical protein BKA58DRAFT_338645, partial [Alternaria rosae]|uniref:uncharacterized protein n=1 Tax=Alternaria rosae TaxID=1187941 RepID=UPI001E8E8041
MRLSWALFVSGICAKVYGGDTQQVFGSSLELAGTSFTCENGVTPSITCSDPSQHEHSCSCACTNGLKFEQSLPFSSFQPGGSGSNLSPDACQAANEELLTREQNLINQLRLKEEELLRREQEFSAELS